MWDWLASSLKRWKKKQINERIGTVKSRNETGSYLIVLWSDWRFRIYRKWHAASICVVMTGSDGGATGVCWVSVPFFKNFVNKKEEDERQRSCPYSCELILNSFHTSGLKCFPNSLSFLFFWSFHKEASVGIYLLPYSSSALQWNNEQCNNAAHQRQSSKEAPFPVFQSSSEM